MLCCRKVILPQVLSKAKQDVTWLQTSQENRQTTPEKRQKSSGQPDNSSEQADLRLLKQVQRTSGRAASAQTSPGNKQKLPALQERSRKLRMELAPFLEAVKDFGIFLLTRVLETGMV